MGVARMGYFVPEFMEIDEFSPDGANRRYHSHYSQSRASRRSAK